MKKFIVLNLTFATPENEKRFKDSLRKLVEKETTQPSSVPYLDEVDDDDLFKVTHEAYQKFVKQCKEYGVPVPTNIIVED